MAVFGNDWGIVGHEWAVTHLAQTLNHDRLRHAYLIAGVSGIGKTALALAFAQAVNCVSDESRPCGECRPCRLIEAGGFADVMTLQAEDKTLKIEQIRDLQHMITLHSVEGGYRVIILDNFQNASGQAMDALLKTLEEPPAHVLLLLTVDRVDSVLPTIRSRCQVLSLRPLPVAKVRKELERRGIDPEQAALLAQLSEGRLGWALRAVEDEALLKQRTGMLDVLEALIAQDRVARFKFSEQAALSKETIPTLLSSWQSYWRDILLLVTASHISITNRDRKHALEQLAAALHIEDVQRVLNAIQRTGRYIDQNVNARLALDVLMLDLPRYKLLPAPPGT